MKVLNVGVVAHIDHGKSTFTAALISKAWGKRFTIQDLDNLTVEQDRGITVRAQVVRLYKDKEYAVNLIDTPGHVDFQGEVIKTIDSYNLVLILVSAKDGIQSQTINRYRQVSGQGKLIAWVINKVDLVDEDRVKEVEGSISSLSNHPKETTLFHCSAKSGLGLDKVIDFILLMVKISSELIKNEPDHLKVLSLVGKSSEGTQLTVHYKGEDRQLSNLYLDSKTPIKVRKLLTPVPELTQATLVHNNDIYQIFLRVEENLHLSAGSILVFNKSDVSRFQKSTTVSMMYECLILSAEEGYEQVKDFLLNLARDDTWLSVIPVVSPFFGRSFKCQSAGLLHLEVVMDRVRDELKIEVVKVMSLPLLKLIDKVGKVSYTNSVEDISLNLIRESYIPEITLSIQTELSLIHPIMEELREIGTLLSEDLINDEVLLNVKLRSFDLSEEKLSNFYSKTRGRVMIEQVNSTWVRCDVKIIDIWINQTLTQSILMPTDMVQQTLRDLLREIGDGINRSIFEIILRAKSGQKILAAHRIRAYKDDKTVGLYGGDETRKKKVRERQKKGKSKLKSVSTVNFNVRTYLANKLRESRK